MGVPTERLTAAIAQFAPGASIESISDLKGGISAKSISRLTLALPDGSKDEYTVRVPGEWVAKEPPGYIDREFGLLKKIYSAGVASPKPLYLEPEGVDDRFYVLQYIPGSPYLQPTDPVQYAIAFAELHAQLHDLDLAENGLGEVPYQPTTVRTWKEPNDVRIRETEVLAKLEELGTDDVNPRVFRHSDLWPGNVLWQDGEVSGIVDWEEASIGEPLFDISITRLDLLWVAGWEAVDAFTSHYSSLRKIDMSALPRFDLVASLRLAGGMDTIASAYPPLGRPDITADKLIADLGEFVDRALASV